MSRRPLSQSFVLLTEPPGCLLTFGFAFQNISGVMAAVADLLCMKAPSNYEVTNAPDRAPPAPMFRGPGAGPQGMVRFIRPAGPPGALHFPPVSTGKLNSANAVSTATSHAYTFQLSWILLVLLWCHC